MDEARIGRTMESYRRAYVMTNASSVGSRRFIAPVSHRSVSAAETRALKRLLRTGGRVKRLLRTSGRVLTWMACLVFVVGLWSFTAPVDSALWTKTLTIEGSAATGQFGPVEAVVEIHPETLNLKSNGEPVHAFVELAAGYDVDQIDLDTVLLCVGDVPCTQGVKPAAKSQEVGGGGHSPKMKLVFPRSEVVKMLEGQVIPPATVTLTVSGSARDNLFTFAGSDEVRVTFPPKSLRAPAERSLPPADDSLSRRDGSVVLPSE